MRTQTLISILACLGFTLSPAMKAQPLAFPGAEGCGRHTRGGRGGVVFEVSNLNDSGPGSLREAIDASGPRTVVFRVSGTIQLQSDLKIDSPYITIAGQTAPGDGICLRDFTLNVKADHVIIRYLRFRLGDVSGEESDAVWGRYRKYLMIDHCTASWSVDEGMSFYGNDSSTVQWCLISESLYGSVHSKGAHGYGGIWGGRYATFHHNLFAHHSSRTPRFAGGETPACVNVDFVNNVIYNWGFNSAYGGERGLINMIANYYKPGPATKSGVRSRIVQPYDTNGRWYIEDNFVEGSPAVTANNWAGGVQGGSAVASVIRVTEPFTTVPVQMQNAPEAYELVLDQAGAILPARDAVDERIITEVRAGTATYDGTVYELNQGFSDTAVNRGIIDSQNDVGGWPGLISEEPPEDSDHDGIPDDWELDHGLNFLDPDDRNEMNPDGYTMLEDYLNSLVEPVYTRIPRNSPLPAEFTLEQNFPNPFNPDTHIRFSLPDAGLTEGFIVAVNGQRIRHLFSENLAGGTHGTVWTGHDDAGQKVPSGLYLCEIRFGGHRQFIKMQLIR